MSASNKRTPKKHAFGLSNGHLVEGTPTKWTASAVYLKNSEVTSPDGNGAYVVRTVMRVNRLDIIWQTVYGVELGEQDDE